MSPTLKSTFSVQWNDFIFHDNDKGNALSCARCSLSNCEHVRNMLGAHADGEYLIQLNVFELPISFDNPTYVPIALGFPLGDSAVRPYSIDSPVEFSKKLHKLPDKGIGLLSPGEGRAIARLGFAVWLTEWATDANPECQSSAHKPSFNVKTSEADSVFKLVNLWNLLTSGACYWCNDLLKDSIKDLESAWDPHSTGSGSSYWSTPSSSVRDRKMEKIYKHHSHAYKRYEYNEKKRKR